MRAASKWEHYGYREYTKIRARDAFKKNKGLTDKEEISKCIKEAQDSLGIPIFFFLLFFLIYFYL
jgi:hypothetical protein